MGRITSTRRVAKAKENFRGTVASLLGWVIVVVGGVVGVKRRHNDTQWLPTTILMTLGNRGVDKDDCFSDEWMGEVGESRFVVARISRGRDPSHERQSHHNYQVDPGTGIHQVKSPMRLGS